MFGPSSWVRVSQYARVVPRSAPSFAWTGRSPVAQLAERSAVNRRVGGSSPPGGAGHSVFSDGPRRAGHRLFTGNDRGLIVYSNGAVQQLGDLRMDAAPFHVHVLGHRHVCVAEVVGADAGRKPLVVDESRNRLAERMTADTGCAQLIADLAPDAVEVH
jgi:hypothetical protein